MHSNKPLVDRPPGDAVVVDIVAVSRSRSASFVVIILTAPSVRRQLCLGLLGDRHGSRRGSASASSVINGAQGTFRLSRPIRLALATRGIVLSLSESV